jgi:hypothetical protein
MSTPAMAITLASTPCLAWLVGIFQFKLKARCMLTSLLNIAGTALVCAFGLGACGGGGSDSVTTPASAINTLACTNPGGEVSSSAGVFIPLFATIYDLEVGNIDPLTGFVRTSALIFKLAADGGATIDGAPVPVSSACYQAKSNTLVLSLRQSDTLTLSSDGKATGMISGQAVQTKPK